MTRYRKKKQKRQDYRTGGRVHLEEGGIPNEPYTPPAPEEEEQTDSKLSKGPSEEVQILYNEQGEAAAFDIIEQFKPITNKLVQRRSEAPDFDRQLLTDEKETGKRGILDLIREYKPESGVPLAAFINKFLPSRAIAFADSIANTADNLFNASSHFSCSSSVSDSLIREEIFACFSSSDFFASAAASFSRSSFSLASLSCSA